jgi:hypothetical protein
MARYTPKNQNPELNPSRFSEETHCEYRLVIFSYVRVITSTHAVKRHSRTGRVGRVEEADDGLESPTGSSWIHWMVFCLHGSFCRA